ncbi:MAG: polyprenyl diphosphate synthase [Alphaproteobacteria bacterium]|jgi:undecaprenyl diphosphate synthase|nr:polyprenyl diphosphate synthase [Alphaproteobacteria bacterium]
MAKVKEKPKHIAVVMDGNGRWAKAKGMPRMYGHKVGVDAVNRLLEACKKHEIKYITIYAFSTENWKRPKGEVDGVMNLLRMNLKRLKKDAIKNKVKVKILGDKSVFDSGLKKLLVETEEGTKDFEDYHFNIALNYGGKEDITQACKKIATMVKDGNLNVEDINADLVQGNLYTEDQPPVDLMIRTSYEHRISNFLLWQLAYAELVFLPVMWPDFSEKDLVEAIDIYMGRERRFGNINP